MSLIDRTARPSIVFDPANKNHRKMFHEFVKTGRWDSCPVQFYLNEGQVSIVHQIQQQLSQHYLNKEFA